LTRADCDSLAGVAGPAHWSILHDAWQAAMLASPHAAGVHKEPLPAAVIIAIVEHRLSGKGGRQDTLEVDPGLCRRVALLRRHARDAQGRNWDIPAYDAVMSTEQRGETEFRRVVDALREQFDIA
jgi:hypothetical protein